MVHSPADVQAKSTEKQRFKQGLGTGHGGRDLADLGDTENLR